jgi:hypothetical protein
LKDIVNPNVREALERLERAIGRIDAAALARGSSDDTAALKKDFERLRSEHAALTSSAGHVADRLDAIIGQVRTALEG